MTILIVDDNPRFRELVREFFPRSDTVLECADGSEAVRRHAAEHPDWIIMDVVMEPMNGFDALKEIRCRDPKARVIMITQFADTMYRARALELGAVELLSKMDVPAIEHIILGHGG